MSTHLPIRNLRSLHQRCIFRRPDGRPFSTTLPRFRGSRASLARRFVDPVELRAAARYFEGKSSEDPTIVEDEEVVEDDSILPEDIGLLPGTFVRKPVLARWTSLRQSTPSEDDPWYRKNVVLALLYYEARFLAAVWKQWYTIFKFKSDLGWRLCPSLHWFPLDRGLVYNIGREKYCFLYESFAKDSYKDVTESCVPSLAKAFNDRIAARPPGLKTSWSVDRGSLETSMVSNRARILSLPGWEGTGLHQVVLRIQSNQSIAFDASKTEREHSLEYASKKGTVIEYPVLQRVMVDGKFRRWKIWGFANEWELETIKEDDEGEKQHSAYQSKQSRQS